MRGDIEKLSKRLLDFTVCVIKQVNTLPRTTVGRHVAGQLLRSGTSAGANYEECCAAESRLDFVHKMKIVLKELRESRFWLRLIERVQLISKSECHDLTEEVEELCNIIAKSIITAKKNL